MFSSFRNYFLIKAFLCSFSEGDNLYFDFTSKFLHHIKWGSELFSAINVMHILLQLGTVPLMLVVPREKW